MAAFKTPLKVQKLAEKTWALLAPLVYRSDQVAQVLTVPKGFITDYASVVRAPIAFWIAGDRAHEAATVHDYLYQTHHCRTREKADKIFLEAMEVTAIPAWIRKVMYGAVRVAGMLAWRSGPSRFARFENYNCCDRRRSKRKG